MKQSKLDDLMLKVKKGQMERHEYEYISNFLGDKNFLIFGTGHDTEFWRFCNTDGLCIFLEHDSKWIPEESKDVYKVQYKTVLSKYQEYLDDVTWLEMDLPQIVNNTSWDVIFVDGPPGNKTTAHGRMQSIYAAWKLADENTEVFVHDCDRTVENAYTRHFFETKKDLVKLRHCTKKEVNNGITK